MTVNDFQSTMELSTVETIVQTINSNIFEFYNFVRLASNDTKGRELLNQLLKLKSEIREKLFEDCEEAKDRYSSNAIKLDIFEDQRRKVGDDAGLFSVMDALNRAFSDYFVYIVVANDSEDHVALHDRALVLLENIEKYITPKMREARERMAEKEKKTEAEV